MRKKRKRTYLDAGVLLVIVRGKEEIAEKGLHILDDPEREFVSSPFLKLEVLPKAVHGKYDDEVMFYEEFFSAVRYRIDASEHLVEEALGCANAHGRGGMDALHVAAAIEAEADKLVTTEKPTKPIHRVKELPVVSIYG